ncbi:MAG: hypothetical protein KF868_02285 [Acidobacteria bacterium]|nr:hypothetical protein [Acidobacteriota bacterium]MCW5967392.1 hypothetical protein [Blastocatellales bacterium]
MQYRFQSSAVFAAAFLFSAIAILPYFYIGGQSTDGRPGGEMPAAHDLAMHVNQMKGFHRALIAGNPYPRWQEDTRSGFGAPTTVFYPPATYYLTSLFYFFLGDWRNVLMALYMTLMAASGLAFYSLARRFFSPAAAYIGMFVYIFAPYHLINVYQRGAVAECFSFIWTPLALKYAWDLIDENDRAHPESAGFAPLGLRPEIITAFVGLALCWGLFIFSHPPTAYQFALIWGPVGAVYLLMKKRLRTACTILAAIAVGTLLAGVYIYPAVIEQKYIHSEDIVQSFPYHESYVFLFSSMRYDHQGDGFLHRINHIWLVTLILIVLISLFAVFLKRRGVNIKAAAPWIAAGLIASWMMTVFSRPLGSLIPKIEIGVFSWRMLALTAASTAMLTAFCWEWRKSTVLSGYAVARFCCALVVGAVLVAALCVSYDRVVGPTYGAEAFRSWPDTSYYATAPRDSPRLLPDRPAVEFVAGAGEASIEQWLPESRRIVFRNESTSVVSVRISNYPGWTARINGEPVSIRTGRVGEIVLDMPAGTHTLTLDFLATADRRLGAAMTFAALVLLAAGMACRKYLKMRAAGTEKGAANDETRQMV